jgi:thiamine biosynthesis protein ThiS
MIRVNGEPSTYIDECVEELLIRLGIEQRGIAVALNGEIVRRSQWSSTRIVDTNVVEIVTAAAGG